MKDFLKMTLAVVLGMIIVSIISTILTLGFIGSLAASGASQTVMPKSGILKIDLSTISITENDTPGNPMSRFSGLETQNIQLLKAVRAIKEAQADPAVKCIYVLPDGYSGSLASLEELRKSLEEFRLCGKPVVAYTEVPTTGGMYLASVADKVYMTSHLGATHMFFGISSQLVFIKDLLDRLGVNVQLIRHGKYKSAGEMFVRSTSSPENMEQNQEMINSLWNTISDAIARSREITVEELNRMIDGLALVEPEDFLEGKLVDALMTAEELKEKLAVLAGVDKYSEVKFMSLPDYASSKFAFAKATKKMIAVIYADGEIVDGKEAARVAGDRFASVISKVRADSTIKAVVLRVNSPGGSVLASDKIKAELDLLKQQKPLIASYGDLAASGGYWISNNCDKIFTDATTLTGSIGVFSVIPDFSGTLSKVAHVNVTSVGSSPHADMYGLMRPLDKDEIQYMQSSVEDIYDRFVRIVCEGRGLESGYVDSIAQGRVWTGKEAIEKGLVDEIGTLADAIDYAGTAAGKFVDETWSIAQYPAPQTAVQMLLSKMAGTSNGEDVLASQLSSLKAPKQLATMPYEITLRF